MPIKLYQPTTSARRHASTLVRVGIKKNRPHKSLVVSGRKTTGRNNQGKITVRHRGGGSKKKIRIIDFRRDKLDIPAKVSFLEYDPNRNANIALLSYADGEKRYIIAPESLKAGQTVMSSHELIDLNPGNALPLKHIPAGMFIYNVELAPGKGGQLARSAGNSIYLMGFDGGFAQLKMPSSEVRLVDENCLATIGAASNADYQNIRWGKAGRMRHRGIRPTVRGKAMNPVDHPHGGGEGKNPIGLKAPKTPWGKLALGVKTRRRGRKSNRFVLQRRKSK